MLLAAASPTQLSVDEIAMTDIDITRKLTHRLLAELSVVISELLRLEDYGGAIRLLELRNRYEKAILDA
jgi:hypothetical protein